MDHAESLRLFGTFEPAAASRRLEAGALSCEFEGGMLRHVRWGDVEIARGIAYLLRDCDWGTVPALVSALAVSVQPGRFTVDCTLRMHAPAGTLQAVAHIEGDADGHLSFAVRATPDQAMPVNRCGFVVLHPANCAGRALSVEHTGGDVHATAFPREISPSQPVSDIRGLTYAPAPGLTLECRLEAELPGEPTGKFEMEDQRNWSDASFKTYVGSLRDPWPYTLPARRPLAQQVTLKIRGTPPARPERSPLARELKFGAPGARRMPAIGVGVPPGLHRASTAEHDALRALGAAWWIIDATLGDESLADDLATAATLREGLDARVQLDLVVPAGLPPEASARLGAAACRRAGLGVDAVRILPAPYLKSYQPSDAWPELPPLEAYAEAAGRHFPHARVGGGMFTYFTELNRKRPSATGLDFIGHATCPIVHAADDISVMESAEALESIVHSVRHLWPGLAYRLGPSTIASHRNPYGNAPVANPELRRLALADADPRHRGQFGAAWTLAYAAATVRGVDVLALHHSHGASGPIGNVDEYPPTIVPAWTVLRTLSGAAGARIVPIDGGGPDIAALAWSHGAERIEGLVANLGATSLRWRMKTADAPATLAAYEIAHFSFRRRDSLTPP